MGRAKGGHPLIRLAVARAKPVSRQTLSALGWPAKIGAKKPKAQAQSNGAGAVCQKPKELGPTRLITQKDQSAERAAGQELARERQQAAKGRFLKAEDALKKRMEKTLKAAKRAKKRLSHR